MKTLKYIALYALCVLFCANAYSISSTVTPHEMDMQDVINTTNHASYTTHNPAMYTTFPAGGGGHIATGICAEICPGKQIKGDCYYAYLDQQINFTVSCDYYYPKAGTSGKITGSQAVPINAENAQRAKAHEEGHVAIFNAFTRLWKSYEDYFNSYVSDCFKTEAEAIKAMQDDMKDAAKQLSDFVKNTYTPKYNSVHSALKGAREDPDGWKVPDTTGWESEVVSVINGFNINFKHTSGHCQCE